MSVKGYLALLVGTVAERKLAGDLGDALDDITREHDPKGQGGPSSGAGDGWEGLLRRADTGLEAAKEGGRERVVTGPPADLGSSTPEGGNASR